MNRTVDKSTGIPRTRTIFCRIVADFRPFVDERGDISELALTQGCPRITRWSTLVILVGRARMDSANVIRRACSIRDLGWDQARRIVFVGANADFIEAAAHAAR